MEKPIQISKNNLQNGDKITFDIEFKKIDQVEKIKSQVFVCGNQKCESILTKANICEICGSQQIAQPVELKNQMRQIIIEDNSTQEANSSTIFCVDCSGTMEGARIECMRSIIQDYVDNGGFNNPNDRVCVVLFDTDVYIYGDGTFEPIKIPSYAELNEVIAMTNSVPEIKKITQCQNELKQLIPKIQPNGLTCAVSALLASTIIAARYSGRVVFCTDGSSNRGISTEESNINLIIEKAKQGGVKINCYSFGDCHTFMLPYKRIHEETTGEYTELKSRANINENKATIIPSLKSNRFGITGKLKVVVPPTIKSSIVEMNYTSLDDLMKQTKAALFIL